MDGTGPEGSEGVGGPPELSSHREQAGTGREVDRLRAAPPGV